MITIHHLLPCSYYVGLLTALEVCRMSPSFVPSRCMGGKGFVRALEASRISTFFERVLVIVIYDLLPCSNYEGLVAVLEVCHLSPPFPWSCDLVGA